MTTTEKYRDACKREELVRDEIERHSTQTAQLHARLHAVSNEVDVLGRQLLIEARAGLR